MDYPAVCAGEKETKIMKKEIKALIAVILAVWCFFMGFEIGTFNERKSAGANVVPQTTTIQQNITPATTTAALVTTNAIVTTTGAQNQGDAGSQETTGNAGADETTAANNASDPSSMTKEQILAAATKAITDVRNLQNFTGKKTETVTIELTDVSVPGAKNTINNIIQSLAGEEVITYTFVDGKAVGIQADGKEADDGEVRTVKDAIPPSGRNFALTADGVKDAKAEKQGDNFVYTLYLVEENTTKSAPIPTHHHAAYGYLDLTNINISVAEITDANMHYPSTVITVVTDAQGKALSIHTVMPMTGDGTAKIKIGGITGNASFQGSDDELWEFTY